MLPLQRHAIYVCFRLVDYDPEQPRLGREADMHLSCDWP